jgi:KaiC/GvpD/RAD55 family RecA-like ATPase
MEKVKTGIPNFDELIGGGFYSGSSILVSGSAGAGKTIFSLQFLYTGALNNEPGVYISLEENVESIERIAEEFKWNLKPLKAKKLLSIVRFSLFSTANFEKFIFDTITKTNAKRVVIDSISAYGASIKEEDKRREVFRLIEAIKRLNCTVILTSEVPTDSLSITSRFGIEEFMTDAVVFLYNIRKENVRVRAIEVLKARGISHDRRLVPFEITDKGIAIHPEGKVY